MSLSQEEKLEYVALLEESERRAEGKRLYSLYPDEGPLRRELYPKHLDFFRQGRRHRERCMMAANRVGKTWGVGGYELALHLTGLYPEWWDGIRFEHPIDAWAVGETLELTRDVSQLALFGDVTNLGSGLIPRDCLMGKPSLRTGKPGAIDSIKIRHTTGNASFLQFKSYDQKRESFQGTAKHVIWMDEEPPIEIYMECLARTMTTNGVMLCTFTPLLGLSDVALLFLPELAPKGEYDPVGGAANEHKLPNWQS